MGKLLSRDASHRNLKIGSCDQRIAGNTGLRVSHAGTIQMEALSVDRRMVNGG
jgi:hypothetical protein